MKQKIRSIGIIGVGMVGGCVKRYFEKKPDYKLFIYDKGKNIGSMEEVNKADFVYVCVPTPYIEGAGCDVSIARDVISKLEGSKIIIIKSTVIPGTTELLQKEYPQHKILFNPEFLTEATADQDMEYPDRQIIGYTDNSYNVAKEVLMQLPLAPFERIVPATESEMIKYANNSWFAVKVGFVNQLYDLCEKVKIDYKTVLEGLATDKRVGRTHLKVWHKGYRGFGGKCLVKDSKALLFFARQQNVSIPILESTDNYNDILLMSQDLKPLDTDASSKVKEDNEKRYTVSKEIRQKK